MHRQFSSRQFPVTVLNTVEKSKLDTQRYHNIINVYKYKATKTVFLEEYPEEKGI